MGALIDMTIVLILFIPSSWTFLASVSRNFPSVSLTTSVEVAHNTTTLLRCRDIVPYPLWHVNESLAESPQYTVKNLGGSEFVGELTISGNETSGILDLRCKGQNSTVYITSRRLTVQGPLPPPENVNIIEHLNSSTIEWNPPYSARNNESNVIHVDPHITQYTVYITDNSTGNIIIIENVTVSRFLFNIQNDSLCPVYQVSAWNAGGEGEPSEPVQKSTPQVQNISAILSPESDRLHINVKVDVACTSRTPQFHSITLMNSAGNFLIETRRQHQPGQAVADFTISLPQSADVCPLHVRIRAGNSAGMSAPSETTVVTCPGSSTGSTTTAVSTAASTAASTTASTAASTVASTAASTAVTGTESGNEGNREKENTTTIIAISAAIGVIAAVGGVLIVAVGIICYLKHRSKDRKVNSKDKIETTTLKTPVGKRSCKFLTPDAS